MIPSSKPKLGAQRGKALHGVVEEYLKTAPKDISQTVMEFAEATNLYSKDIRHGLRSASEHSLLRDLRRLHHDPSEDFELLIEQRFDMSPVYMGFIDLVVLDRRSGRLKVTIRDHKFTSDKRYVPSEELASQDYQTLIYARAITEFFSLDSVTFAYDYYGTKYKWQKFLQLPLTRAFLESNWLRVSNDTHRVLDNYTVPKGSLTTPNYLSCQNYGGCEFKELCFGGR